MRSSFHSTEVHCIQIGGIVRTPELKGPGRTGPVGYDPGSEIGDLCQPASPCTVRHRMTWDNVKTSTVVPDHNHLAYIKEMHATHMSY